MDRRTSRPPPARRSPQDSGAGAECALAGRPAREQRRLRSGPLAWKFPDKESRLSLLRMHWDHEPWKAPASRTHSKRFAKSQALGHCAAAFGVRGACSRFRTRFMERGTQRPRGCDRTSPSPQPFPRSCLAGRGSTRLQRWWVCQDAPVSICAHLPLLTERLCDSVPGRAAPEVLRNNPAIGTDEKSGGNAADTELVGEFGLRPFAKKALYPF